MSMMHLIENTYVDTSLVTCAEYQLFLDEEQAYNRFFQPDHWEIAHFPAGQGRFPILGVRPSDALAFCRWLTQRDIRGWQYRLPTQFEQNLLKKN